MAKLLFFAESVSLAHIGRPLKLAEWAKKQGWYVVVVSNQSGLARGKFSKENLQKITDELQKELKAAGAETDAWYYCPFLEKGSVPEYSYKSVSRKPLPGLLLQAAVNFPIDFERSVMVGDKVTDRILIGGVQSLLIKGRYPILGTSEFVFESLRDVLSFLRFKT